MQAHISNATHTWELINYDDLDQLKLGRYRSIFWLVGFADLEIGGEDLVEDVLHAILGQEAEVEGANQWLGARDLPHVALLGQRLPLL